MFQICLFNAKALRAQRVRRQDGKMARGLIVPCPMCINLRVNSSWKRGNFCLSEGKKRSKFGLRNLTSGVADSKPSIGD